MRMTQLEDQVSTQAAPLRVELSAPAKSSPRIVVDGLAFSRGGRRFRIQGVTYGPFAPAADGTRFPSRAKVQDDFRAMREAGINSIRLYHVPPAWFLDLADELELAVMIDVPWPKHL